MKVVINALSARRGGGQTYLFNLLQYLDGRDELKIIVLAPDSLVLTPHPLIKRIKVGWPVDNQLVRAVWEKYLLSGLLQSLGADILFCPGGLVRTRVPDGCLSVTMFRNMIPFDREVRKMYPPGLRRVRNWLLERGMLSSMRKSDLVIFISNYARQVIESRIGMRQLSAVTIPHGINHEFRVPSGSHIPRPGWLPDGDYLLYVSIFEVYKSQLEVVRGYHLLRSRRETSEKLVLVGQQLSPSAPEVVAEIARLGLQNEIIVAGSVPYRELPAVYANAKVNIFASTCENCPNILLEALGAGRPVLVSNRQPMPEFGGQAVVYFDPVSPEDFADKLLQFIDSPKAMAGLAMRARDQSELFNWEKTATDTWDALQSLYREAKTDRL